jgi:hypothetical protein
MTCEHPFDRALQLLEELKPKLERVLARYRFFKRLEKSRQQRNIEDRA